MAEKLSAVGVILLIVVLLVAFVLYVYLFSPMDGTQDISIVLPSRIQGVSIGNNDRGDFLIPEDAPYETINLFNEEIEQRITNSEEVGGSYSLSVSKLNIDNPVIPHTNTLDTLKDTGWILLPWTYKQNASLFSFLPWIEDEPRGEAIIGCYRRFYGESHPMTCMNNYKLLRGDSITFDGFQYIVKAVTMVDSSQTTVFDPSDEDYLKIITTSGTNPTDSLGDSKYIVVIAKRV